MKISQDGINLIKYYEGLRTKAYLDSVGVATIGYGHTKGVKLGMIITETKAEELLKQDLEYFENKVLDLVKVNLTQHQFDALVSFAFNVGEGNLKKSTLLKKLNNLVFFRQSEIEAVADEFLKWNKAGGKVLAGLTKRRQAERLLFLKEQKFRDIIAELDALAIPKPVIDMMDKSAENLKKGIVGKKV
jgi:GH24 family phage-related lysozyme (muramidase)